MGAMHSLNSTNLSGTGKQHLQAFMLFDTGSQRTLTTQDMKHKLELKTMRKEFLYVTTLGSFQSTEKTYDMFSFSLETENENIQIKALVSLLLFLHRYQLGRRM